MLRNPIVKIRKLNLFPFNLKTFEVNYETQMGYIEKISEMSDLSLCEEKFELQIGIIVLKIDEREEWKVQIGEWILRRNWEGWKINQRKWDWDKFGKVVGEW
jgi:hypothetical protein